MVVILYVLTSVACFAAVPKDDLTQAKQVPATLYFENIFGSASVAKGLNILVVISSFGDILAVMLLDMSRVIQECGRQGATLIMIIASPARDDFNFAVDLRIIPESFFDLLMGVGLLIIRRRHKRLGLPARTYRAWDIAVYFNILKNVYLLVMPWYPPDGGARAGEVSFWRASYAATGVGIQRLVTGPLETLAEWEASHYDSGYPLQAVSELVTPK
ncbi:hypothetical protein ETB97_008513 [Aspergillus alliaceus]|uniref:Uncharacterized protein n=1 Tax=Petromyces alliaceus TaxID=209559 RepID=A0A8H6E954_PETAA|nr:hypothetical protein ETB97_008513 [Aspergillus burnettii]